MTESTEPTPTYPAYIYAIIREHVEKEMHSKVFRSKEGGLLIYHGNGIIKVTVERLDER